MPRPVRDGIPASRLQLPPGPWATLLDGLCARFPGVDRATWADRFRRGRVLDAEGRALAATAAYRAGTGIHYFREVVDEPRIPFAETVLHVDGHLLVVDKPHFLPVAPTGAYVRETLLTRLVERFDNRALVPLHRIDRDTAGLVLFSVNPDSRTRYQALFRERRIRKEYFALAPPLPDFVFPYLHRSRLERGEPFFRMREVSGESNSETVVDVAARGPDAWWYRLEPVTGRKHQLRVHMAALGAPIQDDPFYPALRDRAEDSHARPMQLFAQALEFVDPLTGEHRCFARRRDAVPPF
ncbi:pseudouridine synthase [Luteimonas terricola]|uniref:Pseudouridine synthase n=1 Tax=Luteimonas terricola TaxID=645597 RepID=A0ABQ2EAG0_9GAMM|nr:pseudouridine synthase [Luteimonas terricola]GGK03695.1 pseudouridine synthase [Luteimonas terricola]